MARNKGRRIAHFAGGGYLPAAQGNTNYNVTNSGASPASTPLAPTTSAPTKSIGYGGGSPTTPTTPTPTKSIGYGGGSPTTPTTPTPSAIPAAGAYNAPRGQSGTGGINATAQGLPSATPATGYTPGPQTNAAGSWGGAAESGGIPGDTNVSPQGTPNAWNYGYTPPAATPAPAALPAAAPNVYPTAPTSTGGGFGSGGYMAGMAKGGTVPNMDDGGAIPDTADIPIDSDQGQSGQAGDQQSPVQSALSAARQQFGLSDSIFNSLTDQLAGNIPAKPAGSGGEGPNPNPFPTKNGGFGQRASKDDNDGDEEASS